MAEKLAGLNKDDAFKNIASATETKSVASNAFVTITTLDISKGEWLLIGQCAFTSNGGMNAIVMVEDSATSSNTMDNSTALRASTGSSDVQKVRYYSASTNTTIYLRAYHNSGSDMNVSGNLRAIKLA